MLDISSRMKGLRGTGNIRLIVGSILIQKLKQLLRLLSEAKRPFSIPLVYESGDSEVDLEGVLPRWNLHPFVQLGDARGAPPSTRAQPPMDARADEEQKNQPRLRNKETFI